MQIDAFARGLGGDASLAGGAEFFLGAFARVGVHAAVDFADGVAPLSQVLAEVVQRVAMLGEDEQLAPAVGQFVKFGAPEAVAQGGQLGVRRQVFDPPGAG